MKNLKFKQTVWLLVTAPLLFACNSDDGIDTIGNSNVSIEGTMYVSAPDLVYNEVGSNEVVITEYQASQGTSTFILGNFESALMLVSENESDVTIRDGRFELVRFDGSTLEGVYSGFGKKGEAFSGEIDMLITGGSGAFAGAAGKLEKTIYPNIYPSEGVPRNSYYIIELKGTIYVPTSRFVPVEK